MVLQRIFIICCFICFLGAETVSSTTLIEKAKELDGTTITYQGECIGDLMKRGNNAWVNVNDGGNALGIWAPQELFATISYFGNYFHRGDIILIEGRFQRACSEHGGDLDIHANKLSIVTVGHKFKHLIPIKIIFLAIFCSILAGLLFAINFRNKNK